ncbi:MAG: nitroreductase family protein [Spirochaetia bacterium]
MSMIAIEIDMEQCTNCGACIRECGHGGPQVLRDHAWATCEKCFHCFAVCPSGAITVRDGTNLADDAEPTPPIGIQELTNFLASRRSVRHFLPDVVPENLLTKLFRAAAYVPSGGNRHSHEFTVLTGDRTRKKLMTEIKRVYRLRSALMNNPVLRRLLRPFVDRQSRAFLKDREYGGRMRDIILRLQAGEDPVFYRAPVVIIIHSHEPIPTPREDSVLAGYALCLAGQSLGLGTCFVTLAQSAINASSACKRLIGLTRQDNVHAVILVGYPSVRFLRAAPRMPVPVRVMKDT